MDFGEKPPWLGHSSEPQGAGQSQPAPTQRAAALHIGNVADDGLQPLVARRVEPG